MGAEEDPKAFLILIVQTLSVLMMWMMFHVLVGIYFEFAFFETRPGLKNFIYYFFFLISLYFLIKYIRHKWNF